MDVCDVETVGCQVNGRLWFLLGFHIRMVGCSRSREELLCSVQGLARGCVLEAVARVCIVTGRSHFCDLKLLCQPAGDGEHKAGDLFELMLVDGAGTVMESW